MNRYSYCNFILVLPIVAIITFSIIGYAILVKDFSKRMDIIIKTALTIDALILLFIIINT